MAAWVIWFIIAGILFIAEMLSITFYMLWLGIGAVVHIHCYNEYY